MVKGQKNEMLKNQIIYQKLDYGEACEVDALTAHILYLKSLSFIK